MSLSYGFIPPENSADCTSSMFSDAVHALFGDGITGYGSQFALTIGGFTATLASGYALAAGRWTENTEPKMLSIGLPSPNKDRTDAVVCRVDYAERRAYLDVLADVDKEAIIANPSTLRWDGEYSCALYFINVRRGATSLSKSDVTDVRADENLCGYLKPLEEVAESVLTVYRFFTGGFDQEVDRILNIGDQVIAKADAAVVDLTKQIQDVGGAAEIGELMTSIQHPIPEEEWLLCDGGEITGNYPDLSALLSGKLPYIAKIDDRFSTYIYGGGKQLPVGIEWVQTDPLPPAHWKSVTYGGGIFVAIAAYVQSLSYIGNEAAWSVDGKTWNEATLPSSADWESVTYGNGVFVAVANGSSAAAWSTDGKTWNETSLPSSENWISVAYGNGVFVAVAYGSTAAWSTDGKTWNKTSLQSYEYWRSVTYGNGVFVAVANGNSAAAWSTDGKTWNETSLPSSENWISVAYGNGVFVAVAYSFNTTSAYSADKGRSWKSMSALFILSGVTSVTYGEGVFAAIPQSNTRYALSFDGTNWDTKDLPMSYGARCASAYGSGKFVVISYEGYTMYGVVNYS